MTKLCKNCAFFQKYWADTPPPWIKSLARGNEHADKGDAFYQSRAQYKRVEWLDCRRCGAIILLGHLARPVVHNRLSVVMDPQPAFERDGVPFYRPHVCNTGD